MFPKTFTMISNALCGATLLASSAWAQDLPIPIIAADTRGFALGMSSDDVLSSIQADYPGVRGCIAEGRHRESREKFIYSIYLIAGDDKITFYFTGNFSGNWLYSPDLSPIEMAFSKLKAHLRRIGARTFTDMFHALHEICGLYTPDECWNYFKAAGYVSG